ncbi:hypothetical protein S420910_061 [Synechococcus phage S-CAM7]|uniref:Uncharacterized protein n=1 Tax=Synechococcus phage S-CAM7 TaxID=1883368 RepID=A0A1D8KUA2_9CAUD|nr:hypothetical protein S420910_061 [Synechococcus phage S-CAM7]
MDCTRCLHYYEIRGRKICRSPHLDEEAPVEQERSSLGQCNQDGKNFEFCVYRKARHVFLGSIYDENATRLDHYPN